MVPTYRDPPLAVLGGFSTLETVLTTDPNPEEDLQHVRRKGGKSTKPTA
jgi:hypothetical protein